MWGEVYDWKVGLVGRGVRLEGGVGGERCTMGRICGCVASTKFHMTGTCTVTVGHKPMPREQRKDAEW